VVLHGILYAKDAQNLVLDHQKAKMSDHTNRRRFIQAAASSGIGVLAGGCFSSQAHQVPEAEGRTGGTHKAASDSSTLSEPHGVATRFWMDPSIAAWRPGPWRKVHIEFHKSRHVPKLAERFNADEFGDRLLEAHVTGATVFAKDMYGYCYYPSSLGPMHPGLSFDILGAQVALCASGRSRSWLTT